MAEATTRRNEVRAHRRLFTCDQECLAGAEPETPVELLRPMTIVPASKPGLLPRVSGVTPVVNTVVPAGALNFTPAVKRAD
jgi:hypothetical protein